MPPNDEHLTMALLRPNVLERKKLVAVSIPQNRIGRAVDYNALFGSKIILARKLEDLWILSHMYKDCCNRQNLARNDTGSYRFRVKCIGI